MLRCFCVLLLVLGAGCGVATREVPMIEKPLDLQGLVDRAIARGDKQVTVPPGRWQLAGRVTLTKAVDFTLAGPGATLVFPPDTGTLHFVACRNITIEGLTVDCDPLPFTQGTIVSVTPDHQAFEYEVHPGYPRLDEYADKPGRSGIFAFNPDTLRWRQDVPDLYPTTSEAISPTRGRVTLSGKLPGYRNIRVGDYVAFKNPSGGGLLFKNCDGVAVRNVTVLTGAYGFLLRCCAGPLVFDRCVIKRGPTPVEAEHPRLLSTVADGFNVGYSRRGPTVTNCDFSNMGDDAVNLHGTVVTVAEVEGRKSFYVARTSPPEFAFRTQPGDPVRLLDADSYGIVHVAEVATCTFAKATPEQVTAWGKAAGLKPGGRLWVVRFTLEEDAPLAEGMHLDLPAVACPNFVFRGNHFHDHRARGLRIGAPHGVIENNRIERLKSSAITLGPHAVHDEGGWVSDVVVRGNTIRDVAFDDRTVADYSYNAAAIVVQHFLPDREAAYPQANTDISITGNDIKTVGGAGIMAISARGLTIRGNRFADTHRIDLTDTGTRMRLRSTGVVNLNWCRDVTVKDNRFGPRGPSATAEVLRWPAEGE